MRVFAAVILSTALLLAGGRAGVPDVGQIAADDCSCACVKQSCCVARSDDGGSTELPALPSTPVSHDMAKLVVDLMTPLWRDLSPAGASHAVFPPSAEHRTTLGGAALCRMHCTFLI